MSLIQHCYGKIGYLDAVNLTIMLEKFVSSKSNTIKRWALQYGTNSSNSMERHDLPAHKLSKLLKIYALLKWILLNSLRNSLARKVVRCECDEGSDDKSS